MEHSADTIYFATLITYAFTQYYLQRGLTELGENGEAEVTEELSQLHMRDTFRPKKSKYLTKEQNPDALE